MTVTNAIQQLIGVGWPDADLVTYSVGQIIAGSCNQDNALVTLGVSALTKELTARKVFRKR